MTKTDWTAEEVRATVKKIKGHAMTVEERADMFDIAYAFANRIEADESAMPVATVGCHWVGDALGFDLNDISEPLPPYGAKLFTRPPAQPAQEQPGWKVPDGLCVRNPAPNAAAAGMPSTTHLVYLSGELSAPTPPKEN